MVSQRIVDDAVLDARRWKFTCAEHTIMNATRLPSMKPKIVVRNDSGKSSTEKVSKKAHPATTGASGKRFQKAMENRRPRKAQSETITRLEGCMVITSRPQIHAPCSKRRRAIITTLRVFMVSSLFNGSPQCLVADIRNGLPKEAKLE